MFNVYFIHENPTVLGLCWLYEAWKSSIWQRRGCKGVCRIVNTMLSIKSFLFFFVLCSSIQQLPRHTLDNIELYILCCHSLFSISVSVLFFRCLMEQKPRYMQNLAMKSLPQRSDTALASPQALLRTTIRNKTQSVCAAPLPRMLTNIDSGRKGQLQYIHWIRWMGVVRYSVLSGHSYRE